MRHFTLLRCLALVAMLCFGSLANAASKPTMNSAYTVTDVSYVAWQYAQIPASNFLTNATSAEITVKGAVFVAFGKALNQWNYTDYADGVFNWSNSNVAGVTYTISGDVLASAKKGGLYVRTNTSDGLTMTIKNIGEGGATEPEPEVTPTEPEEEALVVEYTTNLSEWNDRAITSAAFNPNATSATLKVKGACYVRFSHKVAGQLTAIKEYSWSSANQSGITYEISS